MHVQSGTGQSIRAGVGGGGVRTTMEWQQCTILSTITLNYIVTFPLIPLRPAFQLNYHPLTGQARPFLSFSCKYTTKYHSLPVITCISGGPPSSRINSKWLWFSINTSFLKRPPSGDSSWMYSPVKYRCTSVDFPELSDPTIPNRSSGTVRAIVHSWLFTNESARRRREKGGNQHGIALHYKTVQQHKWLVPVPHDQSNRIIKISLHIRIKEVSLHWVQKNSP